MHRDGIGSHPHGKDLLQGMTKGQARSATPWPAASLQQHARRRIHADI